MKNKQFGKILLSWYEQHKRDLPWRKSHNPYHIWLSEIILQQTRVNQGLPYFNKFINKYPNIHDLAKAPGDDVLRLWQGLGYYSRARNLHKCARHVVDHYQGIFPTERQELIKLPGIGPCTSAAIASIAFNKQEATVDGNVNRVITRLYGIEDDLNKPGILKQIQDLAQDLVPKIDPGTYNQAIMEFGALQCIPTNPDCLNCPFTSDCLAFKTAKQTTIPYKSRNTKKKIRFFHYLMIFKDNQILLHKRTKNDIWKGLYEFFLIETKDKMNFDGLKLPDYMADNAQLWQINNESRYYRHELTHQTIIASFYSIAVGDKFHFSDKEFQDYRLYPSAAISSLPKSILTARYWAERII